ncbi:hypothetical protein HPCPY3281_1055 [Helicobacter pylori CPY3281]|nr:hypothetical protein HPCPY3281_1055 [Helicobacter pylori CPY3281]
MKPLLKAFKGELDSAIIKGRDLKDLYLLESGAKKHGAKKNLNKTLRRREHRRTN